MSANRQRFLAIITKWPVNFPKKEYDYGYRLRELLKNKTEVEEVFPGSQHENSRKLDALMRLVNNAAKKKYLSSAVSGACGFKKEEMRNLIVKQFKKLEKT